MTRDTIIKLAREAKVFIPRGLQEAVAIQELERFAALVAAVEREACAQVAEWEPCVTHTPQRIAAAIRARGNT